jgi:hypothetical protein
MKSFRIIYNIEVELSEDEIWSDFDEDTRPEQPTEEDVYRAIDDSGGIDNVLYEWSLINPDKDFFVVREIKDVNN